MRRHRHLAALVLLFLAAAALAAACGSGQRREEATPAVEVTAQPTPFVYPTVNPGIPLAEYKSPNKGYSVSYPEGWEVVIDGGPVDTFITRTDEGKVLAQFTVACFQAKEGWTPETLMTQDAKAASLHGGFQTTPATEVELGGLTAKMRRYSLNAGGLAIEHVVAYLIRDKCGWRIGLNTYGAGNLNAFIPLFDRLLASFRFQ